MTDSTTPPYAADRETLRLLQELDRLEELLEEMSDLAVWSRVEVEERLARLNARLDELPDG